MYFCFWVFAINMPTAAERTRELSYAAPAM